MAAGLVNVRAVLGSASGVSDKEIKDSLWYYYFDDEKTVSYLLGEKHSSSMVLMLILHVHRPATQEGSRERER